MKVLSPPSLAGLRIGVLDNSAGNLQRFGVIAPERFVGRPPDADVPWCVSPEDLVVIVAGGPGKHSSLIPTFGATRSVTVAIED